MCRWTFFLATRRLGRWCGSALLLLAMTLPGCKVWDCGSSGGEENAKADPDFDVPRKCRKADQDTDFVGLSDRSRQIESSLGVGK
jgi:hypothetical protein